MCEVLIISKSKYANFSTTDWDDCGEQFPLLCVFICWPGSHSNGPVNAAQSGYFPVISHIPEAASTSVETDSDQSDQWLQRRDRGLHHNLKQNMLHKPNSISLVEKKTIFDWFPISGEWNEMEVVSCIADRVCVRTRLFICCYHYGNL